MPAPPYGDEKLIRNNNNNNQQNGRRRGRGGGQGGGMGGAPRPQGQSFGNNRLDIRQRGNATQLLEKYKTLARDAAQQGDRVVSEYYLQYADHYFRVLNEIRERQPEHQRGPRPGYDADEDGDDVGNGYNPGYAASNEAAAQGDGERDRDRDDQGQQGQRYDQGQREDRPQRQYEDRGQQARTQPDARRDENRRDDSRRDNGSRDDNRQPERGQQDRNQADRGQVERGRADRSQQDSRQRDDQRRDRGESRTANGNGNANGSGSGMGEYRDAPRRAARDDAAATVDQRDSRDEETDGYTRVDAESHEQETVLAGLPGPATLSPGAPAADDAEPPKRRRGRPRKVVAEAPTDSADA